jgi:alpha,alpha-trehalase
MNEVTRLIVGAFAKPSPIISRRDVAEARQYIRDYWSKLIRHNTQDEDTLIGLPRPYLIPSCIEGSEFDFNELYYWDSYFIIQGLLDEEHRDLVMGILENLVSLYQKFGVIPNASRTYLMGRSQPPILTSFIWDIYEAYQLDTMWLKQHIEIAQDEYQRVWMGTAKPHARQVYEGLSRYYDINMLHDLAEAESGWDMTPRFKRQALNYLPVDLNSLLYKYETDFARYYQHIGDKLKSQAWHQAARERAKVMDKLMWSSSKNLYYDYDYVKKHQSTVASLAGLYPMWAGIVDKDRAERLVRSLRRFSHKGGLSATDTYTLNQRVSGGFPSQWAYPNGWAPLHFLVVKGLERYGYHHEARKIARRWIKTNLDWFRHSGVFLEKYNVAQPHKPPMRGLYPTQVGFGWTNAVFERFCQEYIDD